MKRIVFDAITFAFLLITLAVFILNPEDEFLMTHSTLLYLPFVVSALLGAFISYLLNLKKIKTWGETIFESVHQKNSTDVAPSVFSFWKWHMVIVLTVTLVVAFLKTDFSVRELLDEEGFNGARRLFISLFSPDWSVLPEGILKMIETIFMAFLATALAIPFAFVLSFPSAKNLANSAGRYSIYMFLRTLMNVTRSVEALIWALIFSIWVGIGPFAGMLALMVHSVASLTKQYSEIVESVNEGPIEGILSTGATRLQMIWFAIVPQVVLPYISFTVYRWDINVRMATIIGLVGGGGIGTKLIQFSNQSQWEKVGCLIVIIAVVVWLMDQASAIIRETLK